MLLTMDRYTRYNANQNGGVGGGEIGTLYRARFGAEGNGIGSFFRGLFRFVKLLLYSRGKAVGKEALNRFQYNT